MKNSWLYRYAQVVVFVTLGLIFLGGLVTSKNAGMSVPDWPTTFHDNMFAVPFAKWLGPDAMKSGDQGVFWEHSHRLLASGVGLLTVILAISIFVTDRRRSLRMAGVAAVVLVIVQGILGGLRVTHDSIQLAMIHGCVAQAYLCLLIAIAMMLSWRWVSGWTFQRGDFRALRIACWSLVGLVYVQLIVGAIVRHEHAWSALPEFPTSMMGKYVPPIHSFAVDIHFGHRMLALLVCAAVLAVVTLTFVKARREWSLLSLALVLVGLTAFQISLGAHIIWLARPPVTTTLHVVNGALILAVSFIMALRLSRYQPQPQTAFSGSPRPTEVLA